MPIQITENVYWVGVIDWNVRDFHGYTTGRGTTYNSYVVQGEKTAVIDSVKAPFADDLVTKIDRTVGCENVDYVVSNHAEPDHGGSLPCVMESCPQAKLLCTKRGVGVIGGYHEQIDDWDVEVVGTGDSIDLGGKTLSFLEVPMVH